VFWDMAPRDLVDRCVEMSSRIVW